MYAEQALTLSRQYGGLAWIGIDAGPAQPMIRVLRGDTTQVQQVFAPVFEILAQPGAAAVSLIWGALYNYLYGRAAWLHNDIETARAVAASMHANAHPNEWPFAPTLRSMLDALLRFSDGNFVAAENLLVEANQQQQQRQEAYCGGNAALLLAHLYLCWKRPDDAMRVLEPVLAKHERNNTPGLIMWEGLQVIEPLLQLAVTRKNHQQFAARVLQLTEAAGLGQIQQATKEPRTIVVAETGETLTPREVEILQQIAEGANNQQIADSLVISLHTVKRHVTNILQKLGVSSRLEAAAVAHRLLD
jgi:LuxR family maltose regulon positive regulatory protein